MTKPIVTAERLRELLNYDPETGVFTRRIPAGRWGQVKAGSIVGYQNGNGYLRIVVDGRKYHAHRLAWLWVYGSFPTDQIDHRNGVRDDNRLCNLRESLPGENSQNQRKPRSNNTSGFLGVEIHKQSGRWVARIKVDGKQRYLGMFASPELAHAEYLRAKAELHKFNMLDHPGGDMRPPRTYTSKYVGVTLHKRDQKWVASIRVNGKLHSLGYFPSEDEAHAAYVAAKRKHHAYAVV